MDDIIEYGRHLAKVFHGENRVEHLALSLMLVPYEELGRKVSGGPQSKHIKRMTAHLQCSEDQGRA